MKEEDKHGQKDLNSFLRYTNGEMTDRERNDFERELQKDPFAAEAAEGLSRFSADEVDKDICDLGKRVSIRVRKRSRLVFYRIAASVAVLMIISSLFFVVNRNKNVKEFGETTEVVPNPVTMEIPEPEAITQADIREEKDKTVVVQEARSARIAVKDEVQQPEIPAHDEIAIAAERKAEPEISVEKDDVTIAAGEYNAAGQVAPVAAEKEIMAAEYMVAVKSARPSAYGDNKADARDNDYTPPIPVTGKDSFDIYIEKSLRKPSLAEADSRAVVIITFLVRSNGDIDSIRIEKSPGVQFSDEAKRLILEGPSWNPAVSNGRKIDDEARVRIVFK